MFGSRVVPILIVNNVNHESPMLPDDNIDIYCSLLSVDIYDTYYIMNKHFDGSCTCVHCMIQFFLMKYEFKSKRA